MKVKRPKSQIRTIKNNENLEEEFEDEDQFLENLNEMDQTEAFQSFFNYLRIMGKRNQYEIKQSSEALLEQLGNYKSELTKIEKESKEYNMVLHSELEDFVNNTKNEIYAKYGEIKMLKEQVKTMQNSDDVSTDLKQMCILS